MKRFHQTLKFFAGLALLAAMTISTGCAGTGGPFAGGPLFGGSLFQNKSTANNEYASPEMYESEYTADDSPNRPAYGSSVYQRPARTASTGSC